jgi:putative heme-binding domain-containing protein
MTDRITRCRNAGRERTPGSMALWLLIVTATSCATGGGLFRAWRVASSEPSADVSKVAGAVSETPVNSPLPTATPARFVLPEGFVIEPVAGPPLVRYPLFGCFDDVGGLYIAEGTGHSVPGTELVKLNQGKILRLEDTDHDGKFDKSTLYAEGFVSPQGVLWHDGVVYVASHPAIWRLEDTDGDGRADRRDEFVARFNFNGNGCDIHGPFLGPDGRLYWTDGRHGYKIERPDGTRLEGFASRIWRCRTDGRDLERFAGGGFDNPVEVAWTADGEMLGTMDQGAGDCLLHYVEGGVYPEEHPCISELVRTGPLLGVARRYSVELPAALCGTMRYRSTSFGAQFRDELFTTHYMTHKLVRSRLIRDGSTFRAEDTDFLVSSDPHLRLTDVLEDADGSLLAIDMGAWYTYGFLGNVLPRPEMLGAIYRIRRVDAPLVSDLRGNGLRLAEMTAGELIRLLDDARPAVRDRAIARLAKLGSAAVSELAALVRTDDRSMEARTNALWALCRIDGPEARSAIRLALNSPAQADSPRAADRNQTLLMVAVQAAGLHRDPAATGALRELLKDGHLPLRRAAAEALGRIGSPDSVPALLGTLRQAVDQFLEHSLIYALIQINDREAVQPGLRDAHPRVQKAALVSLDQMKAGKLAREQIVPLLESNDAALQQAALVAITRRPEWADAPQGLLRKWLARAELTPEQQRAIVDLVSAGSIPPEIERIAGTALADSATPTAARLLLVGAMQQSRANPLPATWKEGLTQALSDRDPKLCWEALAAVRARGWRQFDDTVRKLSHDTSLPPELRVSALECLSGAREPIDAEAFTFLTDQLSESAPPLLRLAAARTLAACVLTKDQLIRIAGRGRIVSTMILRSFLPVFTRTNDPDVGAALVDALIESPAAEALMTAELDKLLKDYPPAVREKAAPLREKIAFRLRDQAAYLARLTDELSRHSGNADAGKEVFLAPKNNCFACHRAVGRGGTIGPDLSKIGQFRTRSELLESIIFPSFSITPQYQTHTLATRDGRVATGLVVRETADSILLRTTDLAELQFARANVEELAPSSVSLMPDGLEKTLTRQQLADLLEFLYNQR